MLNDYYKYDLTQWQEIVKDIINHPEFIKRQTFAHHGDVSVYTHSVKVSIYAYLLAKKLKKDYYSAAIAGLLHDFYETPWQNNYEKKPFFQQHGFTHAKNALKNAQLFFGEQLNPIIEDAIKKHMFPLNITLFKYKESVIVSLADKYVSLEVIKYPKTWLSLVGLRRR